MLAHPLDSRPPPGPLAAGGPTNLDNLITLCGFHHRLVHREGWQITGNPNQQVTFLNKWGQPHRPARRFERDWHDTLVEQITSTYQPHRLALVAAANAPP